MADSRHVSLSISGQGQILTIPHEFALSGTEAVLHKEGHRLVIEPVAPTSLLALLTTLEDITDDFSDVDKELLSLDDILL